MGKGIVQANTNRGYRMPPTPRGCPEVDRKIPRGMAKYT